MGDAEGDDVSEEEVEEWRKRVLLLCDASRGVDGNPVMLSDWSNVAKTVGNFAIPIAFATLLLACPVPLPLGYTKDLR